MPKYSLESLTPDQLAALENQSNLLTSVLNDPETRKQTLRLLKKKNPNLSLPEIDAEDALNAALETERANQKKLADELAEQRAKDNVRTQREKIVSEGLVASSEIPALEKFMTDNEIPSYEKAAALFQQAKRAEAAASAHTKATDLSITLPEEKELWKNPKKFAYQQAAAEVDRLIAARH